MRTGLFHLSPSLINQTWFSAKSENSTHAIAVTPPAPRALKPPAPRIHSTTLARRLRIPAITLPHREPAPPQPLRHRGQDAAHPIHTRTRGQARDHASPTHHREPRS